MALVIPDEVLRAANLTDREGLIEVLCHLYDRQLISKGFAARVAGITPLEFEDELMKRGMPLLRYTEEMFAEDIETLEKLGMLRKAQADAGRK